MDDTVGRFAGFVVNAESSLEKEFEARIREFSRLVFRIAYGVLRHEQDAEDVAQEAFARAYRRIAQLRDAEKFRAWLVRMTWRLAIDRWRSDRRRLAREQVAGSEPPLPSVEDVASSQERTARLWRAIDSLPEKLRIVIVLGAIEGHDIRQLARLLELPEGTVKSRLFLARKALAEKLQCLANDSTKR